MIEPHDVQLRQPLELGGDARVLLGSAVRFALDERVLDRISQRPRATRWHCSNFREADLLAVGRRIRPIGTQALAGRIEQTFLRRLDVLPADARALMLIAAAEPVGDPLLVWSAADRLGIGPLTSAIPEFDDVLAIRERVTFHHPLVRSAIYRSGSAAEGREVHLARWATSQIPRSYRSSGHGTCPRLLPSPTKRWPPSSGGQPVERRPEAATARRRRSCGGPSRSRVSRVGGSIAPWRRPGPACSRALSKWLSSSWPRRRPVY